MDLTSSFDEQQQQPSPDPGDRESLLYTDIVYEIESTGHMVDTPVFYVRARRADGSLRTVEVEGFRPYFGVKQSDFCTHVEDICNDRRSLGAVLDCSPSIWNEYLDLEQYDDPSPELVAEILTQSTDADVYHDPDPFTTIHEEPVARVFTRVPGDVGGQDGMKSSLPFETFEADIPFERRFLISSEIYRGFKAPTGKTRVRYENWPGESGESELEQEVEGCDPPAFSDSLDEGEKSGNSSDSDESESVDARMVVYDIEVATEGKGFPQPERAQQPINSISAYDSYDDEYRLWGLVSPEWDDFETKYYEKVTVKSKKRWNEDEILETQTKEYYYGPYDDREEAENDVSADDDLSGVLEKQSDVIEVTSMAEQIDVEATKEFGLEADNIEIFESETQLLDSFHDWVLEKEPDIFTGWNSDGFDTPYLIQRSYNKQALDIKNYTVTGNPGVWVNEYNGNRNVDFSLKGVCTLDLLEAYKKTQFRELDSYKLDDVAEAELGLGKVDLAGDELDDAWHYNPIEFFVYSLRDTQATAGIEEQAALLDLYENFRSVTGATYDACNSNGVMLDTMFLRRAYEAGLILPTNREPDEDVYHGAKVFDTVPGKHKNAVYPDLKSMYPNLFAMLNLGTETIIGNKAALEASEYTEDDCFKFPTDNREFAVVPKGESYDHIDRDEYKGVKSEQGGLREIFDPEIEWLYVLKPDIQESFIRDTVDELIELKYNYTGAMYGAVKRVTNCFPEDTYVVTPAGEVPITELEVGQKVYSITEDGNVVLKPVVETKSFPHDGDLVEIETDGGPIQVTPNHNILVEGDDRLETITADMAYHENTIGPELDLPSTPVNNYKPTQSINTETDVRRVRTDHDRVHCVTVEDTHSLLVKRNDKRDNGCMWVRNSVYGVTGDSSSGGVGFRLYDRRVAEGITLAGRMTITHTAEEFTNYLNEHYDPDATLIGGDTDSSVTSIPNAPDLKTALEWAHEAVEYVDASYDEFAKETFNIGDDDEHRLAVELESLASSLFFLEDEETHNYRMADDGLLISERKSEGVQKRYAQSIVWDDDDGWVDTPDEEDYPGDPLTDEADLSELKHEESLTFESFESGPMAGEEPEEYIEITGMEYVRSDSAQITRESQLEVLMDVLLSEDPREQIEPYLQDLIDRIENGDVPLEKLARPKGVSSDLEEYGWKEIEELDDDEITPEVEHYGGKYVQKPGPNYRGAKYANDWFTWEEITPGSKPRKIPIKQVRSDEYPEVYTYDQYPSKDYPESPEIDEPVDAISVENPDRLPDDFIVDREKIIEKEVRGKLEPIVETMGLDWMDLISEGKQSGLGDFV